MASTYLDLYQSAGGLYQSNVLGMQSPYSPGGWSFGTPHNVSYRPGEYQRVVHDTLNNKYYGTQKQSDLVKGLEDSIKRTQAQLNKDFETRYGTGWMGSLTTSTYRYTAADRKAQNASIKKQQQYLDNINNGMYKQEANTFFDSYDDHTQGWNNVFTKRYNNEQQRIKNEKTEAQNVITRAKNEKIRARNKKVGKMNLRSEKINKTNEELKQNQGVTGSNLSYTVPSNNKLEINTGIASEDTKNRRTSNQVLKDNGLNI